MTDFRRDDNRGDWLKSLDRQVDRLVEDEKITPAEAAELRSEGWVNGRRETASRRHRESP